MEIEYYLQFYCEGVFSLGRIKAAELPIVGDHVDYRRVAKGLGHEYPDDIFGEVISRDFHFDLVDSKLCCFVVIRLQERKYYESRDWVRTSKMNPSDYKSRYEEADEEEADKAEVEETDLEVIPGLIP